MEDEFNAQTIKIVVTLRKKTETLFYLTTLATRWDSVVSIATVYGPDGPGYTPSKSKNFCNNPDWSCGPPTLLYNRYQVSLPGGNAAEAWC